jgi:hypothetical protein
VAHLVLKACERLSSRSQSWRKSTRPATASAINVSSFTANCWRRSCTVVGCGFSFFVNIENPFRCSPRSAACLLLGRVKIPATVIDLQKIERGEYAENFFRKAFTPSERVAIAKVTKPREEAAAKERQEEGRKAQAERGKEGGRGKKNPSRKVSSRGKRKPQSRDNTAKTLGVSGKTLEKEMAVVEAAERDPKRLAFEETFLIGFSFSRLGPVRPM